MYMKTPTGVDSTLNTDLIPGSMCSELNSKHFHPNAAQIEVEQGKMENRVDQMVWFGWADRDERYETCAGHVGRSPEMSYCQISPHGFSLN